MHNKISKHFIAILIIPIIVVLNSIGKDKIISIKMIKINAPFIVLLFFLYETIANNKYDIIINNIKVYNSIIRINSSFKNDRIK